MRGERISFDVSSAWLGYIIVCAVRYACGRRTYAAITVVEFVLPLVPYLSDITLIVMSNDLREAEDYGDPNIDKPEWMRLLSAIDTEIKKRGIDRVQM